MSAGLFVVTREEEGVASLCIATDADPYLGSRWAVEFSGRLAALAADVDIRAVVLEGSGPYFSAGASRESLTETIEVEGAASRLSYAARTARALLDLPIPVIAAAAGHAIGGGLLLALWCDVIVMAEESLYAANFIRLGLTPGMGATRVVGEAFGEPLGRDLLFSGRTVTGREIRDASCPLSHAVVPRAQAHGRALSIARDIAEAPRESIVLLKQILARRRRESLEQALDAEDAAHRRLFTSQTTIAEIAQRYPIRSGLANTELL
jgi:enoyl-CoA hydratase/carnithine racemase